MASKPFMQLYIADYLIDTQHLTTLEHGAYLLLIMTYFQTGKSLPDNDKKLASFCKLSVAKFSKVKSTLKDLFFISDGQWFQKRVEIELDRMAKKSAVARESVMWRWEKHREKSLPNSDTNVILTDTEADTEQNIEDKEKEKEKEVISSSSSNSAHASYFAPQHAAAAKPLSENLETKIADRKIYLDCLLPVFPKGGVQIFQTVDVSRMFDGWHEQGVLAEDIELAVSRISDRGQKPSSPKYFDGLVLENCARRKRGGDETKKTKLSREEILAANERTRALLPAIQAEWEEKERLGLFKGS